MVHDARTSTSRRARGPCPSVPLARFRPATRFPVPPADRRRSPDEPDRDRHRRWLQGDGGPDRD